jgi:ribosomal protein L34E
MADDSWKREVERFFHSNRAKKKRSPEREYGANKVASAILERIERSKAEKPE